MWMTPETVIAPPSEPLGPDQREDEVDHHGGGANRQQYVLHRYTLSNAQMDTKAIANITADSSTKFRSEFTSLPPPHPAWRPRGRCRSRARARPSETASGAT